MALWALKGAVESIAETPLNPKTLTSYDGAFPLLWTARLRLRKSHDHTEADRMVAFPRKLRA